MDFVEADGVRSMLRKCPGCGHLLKYNEGHSTYLLQCDGDEHDGLKELGSSGRFSCLACGRYDFCIPCTRAMTPPAEAQQIRIKLQHSIGDDATEFVFCIQSKKSTRHRRTKKQRDFSHRRCVPRERYEQLEEECNALKVKLGLLRRSATASGAVADAFSVESAAIHRARNLSKTKHNSRQVQRYKQEAQEFQGQANTAAARNAIMKQRVGELELELSKAYRQTREATADASGARDALDKITKQLNSARESASMLQGKVKLGKVTARCAQVEVC